MDRLMALRGGAKGMSLAGLNIVVDGSPVPLAQLQEMVKGLLGGGASADEPGGLLGCIQDIERTDGPVYEIFVGTPDADGSITVQITTRNDVEGESGY